MHTGLRTAFVGVGALLAGVLAGTQIRGASAAPPRMDARVLEIRRQLDRLESLVGAAGGWSPVAMPPVASAPPRVAPAKSASEPSAAGPPADSLYALAGQRVLREPVERLAASYAEAVAGECDTYRELQERTREHFLFRTYREVLGELGRPDQVNRESSGPAFLYRAPLPGEERSFVLTLWFADGFVIDVGWNTMPTAARR